MAATLSVKVEGNPYMDGTARFKIIGDWVSHTDGTVSLGIASTYAAAKPFGDFGPLPSKILGVLKSVETIPGALGVPATNPPTDQYDITLLDNYSFDVAGGNLANRSNTVAEKVYPTAEIIVDSDLTLTIAHAGSGLKGRIIMEFESISSMYPT
jgi:hypothetical protein